MITHFPSAAEGLRKFTYEICQIYIPGVYYDDLILYAVWRFMYTLLNFVAVFPTNIVNRMWNGCKRSSGANELHSIVLYRDNNRCYFTEQEPRIVTQVPV